MARRRPSTVLPVLPRGTGGARRRRGRTGLPRGGSYTLSGKYQARIKLNGKRRDLGTFENEEDAAAAYAAAKASGITGRPSPIKNHFKRGTGTARPPYPRASNSLQSNADAVLCCVAVVCGRQKSAEKAADGGADDAPDADGLRLHLPGPAACRAAPRAPRARSLQRHGRHCDAVAHGGLRLVAARRGGSHAERGTCACACSRHSRAMSMPWRSCACAWSARAWGGLRTVDKHG